MINAIEVDLNNNILELIAQYLSSYHLHISSICTMKFSKISINANPLLRIIKRRKFREKIYSLFTSFQNEIKKGNIGEFCSIILHGATRNLQNFYGYIIFTKKTSFLFENTKLDISAGENIINII